MNLCNSFQVAMPTWIAVCQDLNKVIPKWKCPCLRSYSHFWHQINRASSQWEPHGITPHSIFSSTDSLWGWWSSPNKIFSQKLYLGTKKILTLRSLKLFHASWTTEHYISPCYVVSNVPLIHKLHMPSYPIFICHAPIGRPSTIVSHTIIEIFLGSHGCHTRWKILLLSFYAKPFSYNVISIFIGLNCFLITTQNPLFVV